MPNEIIINLE